MATKIEIGCGRRDEIRTRRYERYSGDYDPNEFIGVDRSRQLGGNVFCDIGQGLPFADQVADEVTCLHVLENVQDLGPIMKEFHRTLRFGGMLRIWVPHCFSPGVSGDNTHWRFFTYETFRPFEASHVNSNYYDFHFKSVGSRM